MEVILFEEYVKMDIKKSVIALGQFDGIHLGHQKIIKKTIDIAKSYNYTSILLTFEPHPASILKNLKHFELSTIEDKLYHLQGFNIDYIIVVKFTNDLALMSPKTFINNYLMKLNASICVVGFDYSFGFKGCGKPNDISFLSNGRIGVSVIDKVTLNSEKISSSKIRELLENGLIKKANILLGHFYSFTGIVVEGSKIGRTINLPTANIKVNSSYVLLSNGVYGVYVLIDGKRYLGMMNVGHNPSFNYQIQLRIEVNIFNFNQDIYGKNMRIECIDKIRDEKKFVSKDDFLKQIKKDKEKILTINN